MSILLYLLACLHARAMALEIFTSKSITLPSQAICWGAPQQMADSEKIDTEIFAPGRGGWGAELLNAQDRVSNTHQKFCFTEACCRLALQPYIQVGVGMGVGGLEHNIPTCLQTEKTVCSNGYAGATVLWGLSGLGWWEAVRKSVTIFAIACL